MDEDIKFLYIHMLGNYTKAVRDAIKMVIDDKEYGWNKKMMAVQHYIDEMDRTVSPQQAEQLVKLITIEPLKDL